jgi:hypothetical protein
MDQTEKWKRFGIVVAVAVAALLIGSIAEAQDESRDSVVEAVWKTEQVNFEYRGRGTHYTCGELRNTLRRILKSVGATGELRLRAYACSDEGLGAARFEITLQVPVEATEANLRAITTYNSQRELVARVRGETLPTIDQVSRFAAEWRAIKVGRDRSFRLRPGDCELMKQVRDEILPRLSVRIVRERLSCSEFGNISPPYLEVVALMSTAL